MASDIPDAADFDGATSAVKTLRILELVAGAGEISVRDVVRRTGLPKSSLLRMLGTLADEGFIERAHHGVYRPALKLWRIGRTAVDFEGLRTTVLPYLEELVTVTRETAHYSVYEKGLSTYVEKIEGLEPIRSYTAVGMSSPAYATATGKALLSSRPNSEVERVIADAVPFTDLTIVNPQEFLTEMALTRERNFSVNRGEWRKGVGGIASVVRNRHEHVVAAIGLSGPADRILANVDVLTRRVMAAAEELSHRFGSLWKQGTAAGSDHDGNLGIPQTAAETISVRHAIK